MLSYTFKEYSIHAKLGFWNSDCQRQAPSHFSYYVGVKGEALV